MPRWLLPSDVGSLIHAPEQHSAFFGVDSKTVSDDALVAAAHAKVKAKADAMDAVEFTKQAVRDAVNARAKSAWARWAMDKAEAARVAARGWKQAETNLFLGLPVDNAKYIETIAEREKPGPPLYLPPMIAPAPRLDGDVSQPFLPPLRPEHEIYDPPTGQREL